MAQSDIVKFMCIMDGTDHCTIQEAKEAFRLFKGDILNMYENKKRHQDLYEQVQEWLRERKVPEEFRPIARETLDFLWISIDDRAKAKQPDAPEIADWIDYNQLVEDYGHIRGIKSAKDQKWRETHRFPCRQNGKGSSVYFSRDEILKWINSKGKKEK